jgi:Mg-chelatase subunit ChlD
LKNTEEKRTAVVFILDESGSMEAYKRDTIDGFNEYIETLQTDEKPTIIRLITFSTRGMKVMLDMENVRQVQGLSKESYIPSGGTPLLDAVARGILETDDYLECNPEEINIMFTIMTDGMENSSRNFSASQVSEMIEEREKRGWIFTYLGANQNAWSEGRKMGIQTKYASNYQYSNPKEAMRVMAESTIRAKAGWRRTRSSRDFFTDEEKRRLSRK